MQSRICLCRIFLTEEAWRLLLILLSSNFLYLRFEPVVSWSCFDIFVGQDAIRCAWPGAVVRSGAHAGCQVPLADGARPDSGEQTIPGHQTLWYVLILTIKLFGICVNTGHQTLWFVLILNKGENILGNNIMQTAL